MSDNLPKSNFERLTRDERRAIDATLSASARDAVGQGVMSAERLATIDFPRMRENMAIQAILKRGDGTVITDMQGNKRARRGTIEVIEAAFTVANDSGHVSIVDTSKPDLLLGSGKSLFADSHGGVMTPAESGVDCTISLKIRSEVAKALSGHKLSLRTANQLQEMLETPPSVQGKQNSCKRDNLI